MRNYNDDNSQLIGYCAYCKNEVYSDEGHIVVKGLLYHYDPDNELANCYFPEEEEE